MEFQNGSDDGNNSAAGSSPLENAVTATNGNKRKRKQIDDGNVSCCTRIVYSKIDHDTVMYVFYAEH